VKWRSNFWNQSSVLHTPVIPRIEKRSCQIYYLFFLSLSLSASPVPVRPSCHLVLSIDQSLAGGLIADPNPAPNLPSSLSPSLLFLPFYSAAGPGIILITQCETRRRISSRQGLASGDV
jgi:hypothetical protein